MEAVPSSDVDEKRSVNPARGVRFARSRFDEAAVEASSRKCGLRLIIATDGEPVSHVIRSNRLREEVTR